MFVSWIEKYFYNPGIFERLISYVLYPISFLWCLFARIRRILKKPVDYHIPIISIGNLTVGGSGKTPICIAIARKISKPAIVLRGYKRSSKGLVVVSRFGDILCDVKTSGDEAMLYAKELKKALVIVSEDRVLGIQKAKELGAQIVILDDGFGKVNIKKFDILVSPNPSPANTFCIPSGAYREGVSNYKNADLVLKEDINFKRDVTILNETEKMILVTAIANPSRLDKFLPAQVIAKRTFPDHYMFNKDELKKILEQSGAKSILTTTKDAVKIEHFDLPLSILKLDISLHNNVVEKIETYISKRVLYNDE
ncbi:MAG: tetraacyldisaccharide 4'-kinase [Campylobacteraceae bacterium]|jgi:tetraacyldisaccharide 4'-kinase|nr:tetraacyldisaccharide 4'-kinase [Campylobacteraceae bacterium]